MEMDITLVTAFYDIGRGEWEHYTNHSNNYLYWMERTLSLDANFVIYTQEKFREKILELRKPYDPNLKKTVLIVKELEDLSAYRVYNDRLTELMTSDEFQKKVDHKHVPEMCKPLYNVIMFNKIFWLKEAIDQRHFNTDVVGWVDAGGLREDLEEYKGQAWPKTTRISRDKITFFSHSSDFNIKEEEREFIAMSQVRNIQGTAFFVPVDLIDDLIIGFATTVNECIENGYIGSDEKIFDITYTKDKSIYKLIKCNWREYFNILSK